MHRSLLVALACAALAAAAGMLFVSQRAPSAARASALPLERVRSRAVTPKPHILRPARPLGSLVAWVRPGRKVALRTAPYGRVLAWVGSSTEFGSPQTLAVAQMETKRWLGVKSALLENGRLGWLDASAGGVRYSHASLELDVNLTAHRLAVRRGPRILRLISIGIGGSGSTTPAGRFAITDKLPGARYSSVYGCCILALSGRQTNLPAGWSGGNRLAIHGGPLGSTSAGCLHASANDLDYLMRRVALGTQVVIRR